MNLVCRNYPNMTSHLTSSFGGNCGAGLLSGMNFCSHTIEKLPITEYNTYFKLNSITRICSALHNRYIVKGVKDLRLDDIIIAFWNKELTRKGIKYLREILTSYEQAVLKYFEQQTTSGLVVFTGHSHIKKDLSPDVFIALGIGNWESVFKGTHPGYRNQHHLCVWVRQINQQKGTWRLDNFNIKKTWSENTRNTTRTKPE